MHLSIFICLLRVSCSVCLCIVCDVATFYSIEVKIYSNCVDLASDDDSLFELILALEVPYSPRLKAAKLGDFSGTGDVCPISGFGSFSYGCVWKLFVALSPSSSPQIAVFRRSGSTAAVFGLS